MCHWRKHQTCDFKWLENYAWSSCWQCFWAHGRWKGVAWGPSPPGFWNLTFFCYIFSITRRFLSFGKEKWNFTIFGPLEISLYLPLKKSTNGSHWKNPSDAHNWADALVLCLAYLGWACRRTDDEGKYRKCFLIFPFACSAFGKC